MKYISLTDFHNPHFTIAFKEYFSEFEITVSHWDQCFDRMNSQGDNQAFLVFDNQEVIAFLMFRMDMLDHWFFQEKICFIREFWVKKSYRDKHIGSDLLMHTEQFAKQQDVHKVILTSDSAELFYEKNGYTVDRSYTPRNNNPVFIKYL